MRVAMLLVPAVAQKGVQGIRVPSLVRLRIRVDCISIPTFCLTSSKVPGADFRTEAVAWSVTSAAMADAVRKIGAAIPLDVMARIRLIGALTKEQELPPGEDESHIERKRQVVFRRPRLNRLPRHHEGVERRAVCVIEKCEMVIWEGRVEVRPFAIHTFAHRALEGGT